MTSKMLTRRQARWANFLSRFNFIIKYRPGKQNIQADALTRRAGDIPINEEDERQQHQLQTILKPSNLDVRIRKELNLAPITVEPTQGAEDTTPESESLTVRQLITVTQAKDPFCTDTLAKLKAGIRWSQDIALKECTEKDGLLQYRGKYWIPGDEVLVLRIMQETHDNPTAGHPGIAKNLELIQRQFYWPNMDKDVKRYIKNCHTCNWTKDSREKYHGVLHPLPIPDRPWKDISMDFVTGLPESEGFNAVLTVVDRLTKMRHLIPCTTNEQGGTSTEATASILIEHVWKLHGLPTSIVSDRGPQFISRVWKALCTRLKVSVELTSAYHPETDGQSENANAAMERYLRAYVSYQQDDWVKWLPVAEFVANNTQSATTRVTPFFANYGFHPRMSFDMETSTMGSTPSTRERLQARTADIIVKGLNDRVQFLREQIQLAQHRQERFADRKRTPAPAYRVGDWVYLSTKHLQTKRPSKKLDHVTEGPFQIKKHLGPDSYALDLPTSMRIDNSFHTRFLRPTDNNPLPGQRSIPSPPVIIEDHEEYEVDDILDSRITRRGKLQYKAKWVGYPTDNTWYPAENFVNAPDIIQDFHKRYPHKPGPRH
jgi:hypothetical protein